MDWIVTTARTVEEAQTRALDLLGVDNADAEIQVLEEGKTGLFGRTKSEARVRARIKPKAPPAKEERRPSRGGGDRNRNRNRGGGKGKGGNNQRGGNNNRNRGGNRDGGNGGNRDGGNRGGNQGGNTAAAAAASDGGGNNRSRGGNRDGGGRDGGRQRKDGGNNRGRGGNRDGGNRGRRDGGNRSNEDRVEMPIEEQRETLETFVTGVATAFSPEAKVQLVEEGTTLLAQVNGGDLGRLIGNKASTLQSLEELARTAMHRAAEGRRYHRIQVDVDDYRARRREALAKFATDLARQVADTGESKAMEPMGAADRKLIHDAVAEVAGVETVSEGRDPRRYIVLLATDASDEEE
jgi:spoIIIJ-associated protein